MNQVYVANVVRGLIDKNSIKYLPLEQAFKFANKYNGLVQYYGGLNKGKWVIYNENFENPIAEIPIMSFYIMWTIGNYTYFDPDFHTYKQCLEIVNSDPENLQNDAFIFRGGHAMIFQKKLKKADPLICTIYL